jgi:tetratricopeptide (TPR) repeat protein
MTTIRQTALALSLLLFPLAAQAADAGAPVESGDYDVCVAMIDKDAGKALAYAKAWEPHAGQDRLAALHCEALALSALGHDTEAAARFEEVATSLSTAPNDAQADAYTQAANAWLIAGDMTKAKAAMDNAVTLQRTPEHLMDRAQVRALAKDWEGVRSDTGEVLAELPSDADALALRSTALAELGYPKAALADGERAVSIAPHNLDALLARGRARAAMGNVAGARTDWQDVIRFAKTTGRPDDPAAQAAQDYLKKSGG